MKIQCQSCQAKYTIADEKVLGKVVKIRCKKCGATIVINGNEQPAQAEDGGDTHVFDYAGQSNEQWTVNVADGDQRTMTVAEIGVEYRNGVVDDETFCWKDGMADWLPLREIESIYGIVKLGHAAARAEVVSAASMPPPSSAAPVSAFGAEAPVSAFGAEAPVSACGAEAPGPSVEHANGHGHGVDALFGGGASAEPASAVAARRAGGRAQGADLFGNVEKAGGEDDVMTSVAAATSVAPAAGPSEEKLTGQRNENSVLFSLSALTEKPVEGADRTTATADGSGLIDIRALSASMDEGDKKKDSGARVDDIMNLSGGGAFGAALAAPILAPAPLEAVDMGALGMAEPAKQNKTLVFAILGAGAFVAIAIVAAVALLRTPGTETANPDLVAANATPTDPTSTATSAAATGTPPSTETQENTPSAAADDTPPPPGTGQDVTKAQVTPPPPKARAGATKAAVATPTPAAAPPPKAPEKPKDFMAAAAEAAGKKAPAPAAGTGGGSAAPFDRGAAAAAIGAVNVQSCKKANGPTGSGHVTITFGPNGSVQTVVVDGGPYPGTSVGGCIAGKYRGAHVPPFGGAPVRVGKSFVIN